MRSAYGKCQVNQDKALSKFEIMITNLYWAGKTCRLPFEYGLLAGISSNRELLKCLQQEGYEYLLTCRTNQDCVEVFFGCMRGLSGGVVDVHPDRLQVFERAQIRLLCSEADFIVPVQKPNVQPENLDDFVLIDQRPSEVANVPLNQEMLDEEDLEAPFLEQEDM